MLRPLVLLAIAAFCTTAHAAASAVPTFESIGLYWSQSGGSASTVCDVKYRPLGASTWEVGLPLWFDSRAVGTRPANEYRGSLVHLEPGTTYEIELRLRGTSTATTLQATTWSETFPVAQTIPVPSSSQTLTISQSGAPGAYLLYEAAPGGGVIDVQDAQDYCVRITGAYVIVRDLTCRGARRDGIRIDAGAHDLVLEDNEISGWGRLRDASRNWGVNGDSAIHVAWRITGVDRLVIQRNRIHSPRYTTNSWEFGHPAGPLAINFEQCAGHEVATCGSNHVIRYNDIFGDAEHYYMDAIGGGENFSAYGFPNADSDIYGNDIRNVWDDAIETEGGNTNVRAWGNYMDDTYTAIASAANHIGPLYIFRNVYDVSRQRQGPNDTIEHGPFGKLGDNAGFGGGRRYYFHNTLLQQPPPAGSSYTQGASGGPIGGGSERPMVQTVTRNNIWHIHKSWWSSIFGNAGSHDNDVDFDLHNGDLDLGGTGNRIGAAMISATPIYAPGNGPLSKDGGLYALATSSPGFDAAELLPGFNDGFVGAAPDIGAHEAGTPPMEFGADAYLTGAPEPEPEPEPVLTALPLRLECGGGATGNFLADANVSGGSPYTNWTGAIDVTGVVDPAPQAVYQTERYGTFTYTIPGLQPAAEHRLRLHFSENYHDQPGERVFDVALNGALVLDDLDVLAAAGGAHRAHVEELVAMSDASGRLVLGFTPSVNQALLNGLELFAVEPPGGEPSPEPGDDTPAPDAGTPASQEAPTAPAPVGCACRGGSGADALPALLLALAATWLRRTRQHRSSTST